MAVEPLGVLGQGFDPVSRVRKTGQYKWVTNGRICTNPRGASHKHARETQNTQRSACRAFCWSYSGVGVWPFREFRGFEGAGCLRGVKGELLLDAVDFPTECGGVEASAVGGTSTKHARIRADPVNTA